jgi:sodium transport system permease protein
MIFNIYKKEIKDTLRDRRTIIMMVVIPTLVFPVIMNVYMKISDKFAAETEAKQIKIGLVSNQAGKFEEELIKLPKELGKKEFIPYSDTNKLKKDIQDKKIELGCYVSPNEAEKLNALEPVKITVYHDGTDLGMKERFEAYVAVIEAKLKQERYAKLEIREASITPLAVDYSNVASDKEMFGKLAGGILPYFFIAFGFMGCMYPAIDLFTGEKERGTLETLLTTPVKRWKILIGKMLVVVTSGVMASTFSLIGLFLSIESLDPQKAPELIAIVNDILSPGFIAMLYVLLIPMIFFFAGIMVPIAIRAKSFKEAQSIISPLNMLVVLPGMVGFFPGIELNYVTAVIPVINVVLATKELIAGTLELQYVALAFGVMVTLAVLVVLQSHRKFESERSLL